MAGSNVPYHLRPKKYVERLLFCELLSKAFIVWPQDQYIYISMGGPFLSDHKLMGQHFAFNSLLSFEMDEAVVTRQRFNNLNDTPIKCEHMTSEKFVREFPQIIEQCDDAENAVVWLDYASSKGRRTQIREFGILAGELTPGDVLKITLNCSVSTLSGYGNRAVKAHEQQMLMMADLRQQLGDMIPDKLVDGQTISKASMAKILLGAVNYQIKEASESAHNYSISPVSVYVYNDGSHDMLTITCMAVQNGAKEEFFANTGLCLLSDDQAIPEIKIPDLSIRERRRLETLIDEHEENHIVHENLGFQLGETVGGSISSVKDFRLYKDYLPYILISKTIQLPDDILEALETVS